MLDLPNWTPTTRQVASHLLARTVMANGQLAGTFNTETKPTETQVTEVIQQAVNLMRPRLGPVPDSLVDQAQSLCALRAAYMVERAFFMEQTETSMSPYNSLRGEYKDELCNWDESAKGMEPNSGVSFHSVRVATEYPGYSTDVL